MIVYAKAILQEIMLQHAQQSLWHEKELTTNFDLPEKSWLHFQIDGAAVYAKCRGCRQLHRRNSSCNMESPTSAPPIHANNQAMQHMAYSQWHQHLVFHND